jgi:hypothetical protein
MGSIKAIYAIDLTDDYTGTDLHYNATPDRIVNDAVKVALDQFFKNFEKQVSKVTA